MRRHRTYDWQTRFRKVQAELVSLSCVQHCLVESEAEFGVRLEV